MNTKIAYILSFSIIISSITIGVFYSTKTPKKTIKVVGMASERIQSDRVKWTLTLSKNTNMNDSTKEYIEIQSKYNKLKNFIISKGIKLNEIILKPINSTPIYGNNGINGYTLEQTLIVISPNINTIENLAFDLTNIYSQGLDVKSSNVSYYISDLSTIKQSLLGKAALDAKKRAQAIANNLGMHIGNPIELNTGVFQINEPYSTEFADYGVYNTSIKEKEISITLKTTFLIKK